MSTGYISSATYWIIVLTVGCKEGIFFNNSPFPRIALNYSSSFQWSLSRNPLGQNFPLSFSFTRMNVGGKLWKLAGRRCNKASFSRSKSDWPLHIAFCPPSTSLQETSFATPICAPMFMSVPIRYLNLFPRPGGSHKTWWLPVHYCVSTWQICLVKTQLCDQLT